jgi:hypothetical protein
MCDVWRGRAAEVWKFDSGFVNAGDINAEDRIDL